MTVYAQGCDGDTRFTCFEIPLLDEMRSVHESGSLSVIFSPTFLSALTCLPSGNACAGPRRLSTLNCRFSRSPVNSRRKGQFVKQETHEIFIILHSEQITDIPFFLSPFF